MACSAHAHQGSWMRPNARALVHHVHCAHRAGGTLNGALLDSMNNISDGALLYISDHVCRGSTA